MSPSIPPISPKLHNIEQSGRPSALFQNSLIVIIRVIVAKVINDTINEANKIAIEPNTEYLEQVQVS